jgi:hypothetical protein
MNQANPDTPTAWKSEVRSQNSEVCPLSSVFIMPRVVSTIISKVSSVRFFCEGRQTSDVRGQKSEVCLLFSVLCFVGLACFLIGGDGVVPPR